MSEYIGSRISLISKSDIKYIGTLHEINSDSHTVALESVTSYGTEGRKGNPAEEIPGSDQVYEYIVFRGSDVKGLEIVAPPGAKENQPPPPKVPDDPAILGSARPAPQNQPRQQPPYPQQNPQFGYPGPPPPPNQFQGQPRFQGPGGPHGFPGSPGAVPGYMGFGPPPGYFGPPPGQGFPPGPPPGQFNPNQQMPPPGPQGQYRNQQQQMPPMPRQEQAPIGSKQASPQPPNDQSSQQPSLQPQPKPVEMSATPGPSSDSSAGPPPPVDSKPPTSAATAPSAPTQAQQPPRGAAQRVNNRVAVPLPSPGVLAAKPPQKPAGAVQTTPAPSATQATAPTGQPNPIADATQQATAAVAAAMAKLGPVNQNQGRPHAAEGTDNLAHQVNQMRIHDHMQQQQHRGRGRGRAGGFQPRGGRRDGPGAPKHVEVPKEDYDFESANAKFNKQDLVKEAIATGSPVGSPTNGTKEDPIAALNGSVNGTKDKDAADVVIPPAESRYDKKSSFFDDISSDLKDRAQSDGVDGRAMRREERSRNMETFGQGSVDNRGGYRGRGRGRGFRGGYRARGTFA